MKKEVFEQGKKLLELSFSIIPTAGKQPVCNWGKYQNLPLSLQEFKFFAQNADSIGVICGRDNLVCFDFDNKSEREFLVPQPKHPTLQRIVEIFGNPTLALSNFVEFTNFLPDSILLKSYVEKTPSGGLHLFIKTLYPFQTTVVKKYNEKVEIETRGAGAYAVVAPSPGYVSLYNSLDKVEALTDEENLLLLNTIFSFRETESGGEWGETLKLLQNTGWKIYKENEKFVYLTRPGKETPGNSATIFKNSGLFYVFSTNAQPFEANRVYSQKDVRQLLLIKKIGETRTRKIEKIYDLEAFLMNLGKFQFNVLNGSYLCNGTPLTDKKINEIYVKAQKLGLDLPFDLFLKVLDAIAGDFNPVVEFFNGLEPCSDDTITQFCQFVKTRPEGVLENFLKRYMVACLAQVFGVGRNDFILIFIGPQGIGKSSFLRFLAPVELKDYVAEISLFERSKDALITATSAFITILDELETQTSRDAAFLKSLASSETISFRRPYGKTMTTHRRITSFVGSMNKQVFINDPTGSRRYLVVQVEGIDWNFKQYDIKSAWAHAKHLLQAGFKYWLDAEEIAGLQLYNEYFQVASEEAESLFSLLTYEGEKLEIDLTASQIKNLLEQGWGIKNLKLRNIGMALQKYSFKPRIKKIDGKTAQVYRLPIPKHLLEFTSPSPSVTRLFTRN